MEVLVLVVQEVIQQVQETLQTHLQVKEIMEVLVQMVHLLMVQEEEEVQEQ